MNLFKNMLKEDESLFINEMALDYDYLPRLLPFRDNQQFYLAECIKPLFNKRNSKNVLITGKPGIGKTALVKFVLRDLETETSDIIPVYINCWKKNTAHKIVLEICEQIGYKWVINKNSDELLKSASTIINQKALVLVLDEVDKLDDQQILYSILEDIEKKSIFLISNDKEFLVKLDDRVKSRLIPEILEIRSYSYEETKEILIQRVKHAFVQGIWDEKALQLVAEKSYQNKDIRLGLFLLKESGNIAEIKASKKILLEHCEQAVNKLDLFRKKAIQLNDEEKEILEIVKKNSGLIATQLYDIYKVNNDKSYRTFHRKLKSLEENNLVKISETRGDDGGVSSLVEFKKDL